MQSKAYIPTILRITPTPGWKRLNLREIWDYRELLFFLCWRDITLRYKQTALGVAWAVIQPFMTMLVFSLFFGKLGKMPSDGLPYPIFVYAALVPWNLFANGLTQASNSLVQNAGMLSKVYFPRLVIPISNVISGVVDFVLALLLLLAMMWFYGLSPTGNVLWLPLFLALEFVTALGIGLWLATLNVRFRDVRHAVPFLVQLWMFATPIAYPTSLLSEPWRAVYGLNPMVGVVEGFRWALLGETMSLGPVIAVSAMVSLLVLATGAYYFRRMEETFADIV